MKYICTLCNYIMEEESGFTAAGIEPGTSFENFPEHWHCPDCAAGKEFFLTCSCVSLPLCEATIVSADYCKMKSVA